jgi:hypothetical protein
MMACVLGDTVRRIRRPDTYRRSLEIGQQIGDQAGIAASMSDGTLKTPTSGQKAAGETHSADALGYLPRRASGRQAPYRHVSLGA